MPLFHGLLSLTLTTDRRQISSLLSRPPVIGYFDCDSGLPNLALEDHIISPLLHVKLQSVIIGKLSRRFGTIEKTMPPCLIKEYMRMVQAGMDSFPAQLDAHNPDTSLDLEHEWIPIHRQILRAAAYQMMLIPLRSYLSRHLTLQSPEHELQLRVEGVDYVLRLLQSLIAFFSHAYSRGAVYQVMLLYVFEASATLCSAVMHDDGRSLSRRGDMLNAIQESVEVLAELRHISWIAETLRKIIARTTQRLAIASEDEHLLQQNSWEMARSRHPRRQGVFTPE